MRLIHLLMHLLMRDELPPLPRCPQRLIRRPATPARQTHSRLSACPSGAVNRVPSEPAADTMPSTVLRTTGGTGREATATAETLESEIGLSASADGAHRKELNAIPSV